MYTSVKKSNKSYLRNFKESTAFKNNLLKTLEQTECAILNFSTTGALCAVEVQRKNIGTAMPIKIIEGKKGKNNN